MADLFFTSDEHYGHSNIIKFCKRPFKDIWEEIDVCIKNHNSVVPKGGRTYHIGDMFWRTLPLKIALDIIHALNGQHYFIWGNHDELMEENEILRKAFVWTKDIGVVDHDPKIVLCHYAMRVWRGSHKGTWQLYGHTHNNLPEAKHLCFDSGVDAWNFFPVSIDQVREKMQLKIALGHEDDMMTGIRRQKWDKGPEELDGRV